MKDSLYQSGVITENTFEFSLEEMRYRVWHLKHLPKPIYFIDKAEYTPTSHAHNRISHHPGWLSHANDILTKNNPLSIPELRYLIMLHNHVDNGERDSSDVDNDVGYPDNATDPGMDIQMFGDRDDVVEVHNPIVDQI